ncbi:hypothetical protein CONPUDRAFT_137382 [Coniophora puteana RWD-64-598 SS2]|uniref:Nucleoside diphosphate kinase n=1 Tax=Coniophora puteana (strain RWD-64-598) TaxID=741705 RepID=A0A5M3MRZ5_CONPW|nr:uncharacterized protein CONPUDRAFT_137382 [Coniophora puteana RWD-64-598 SS2]EIW81425.1 hypothetical protein CONPUDRAFT_137382 [Coniophora puteana RWD-64-598 SS2]
MSHSPPAEHQPDLEHEAYHNGHEHEGGGEYEDQGEHDLVQSTQHLTVDVDVPTSVQSSPGAPPTRTVAIIKNHALDRRLDIEHRILESKFEIVKERQMEFDTDSDPETMFEIFGEDAQFLGDGPVWVYVLERRRAVQVLRSLLPSLGDAIIAAQDDHQAEMQIASVFASSPPFHVSDLPPESPPYSPQYDPSSMRSVNSAVLEALRLGVSEGASTPSATSPNGTSSPGNSRARPSLSSSGGSNSYFRAREIPRTHTAPDIAPRLTKAAMLRQGIAFDDATGKKMHAKSPSASVASTGRLPTVQRQKTAAEVAAEKERQRQTFANVPGHKRAETIAVASTAAPAIQPRLTKAAQLRLGIKEATPPPGKRRVSGSGTPVSPGTPTRSRLSTPSRSASVSAAGSPVVASPARSVGGIGSGVNSLVAKVRASAVAQAAQMDNGDAGEDTETEARRRNTFEGVPGHKRRESIQVASLSKAPSIAPRLNRSAALRKEGGAAPPSSFMFRTASQPKLPGSGSAPPSRSGSALSMTSGNTNTNGNGNGNGHTRSLSRSSSRTGAGGRPSLSNAPSSYMSNASSTASSSALSSGSADDEHRGRPPPARRLSSLGAPSIAPRPNKSAMLRAQKMNAMGAAAQPQPAKVFR